MSTEIQLRRDTAANWTSANPILGQGEEGIETDTGKIKYGDGVTAWNSLAYFDAADVDADTAGSASTAQTTAEAFATSAIATETTRAETAEALLAPNASPTFTGTPAAPTATLGTNTTQLATTAFVQTAVGGKVTGGQDVTTGGTVQKIQGVSFTLAVAQSLYPTFFNVRSPAYGATGNGGTDDTAAVQAAITAAAVLGGTVYFPAGTYRITAQLTGLTGSYGVKLLGDGIDQSIINVPASSFARGTTGRIGDTPLILIGQQIASGDPDFVVEDLCFNAAGYRNTGGIPQTGLDGVYICGKAKLNRVKVSGFDAGIIMDSLGGHITLSGVVSTKNYYNCLWASNNDDNFLYDCDFNNAIVANIAMDDRIAGINSTLFPQADYFHQVHIIRSHMGFSPYGIYQAPLQATAGEGYLMGSSIFDLCKFEKCGNGGIWSDYGTAFPKVSTMTIGNTGVLTDTAQSWTTNAFVGQTLTVGTGAMKPTGVVTANTSNTITVSSWTGFPVHGEQYSLSGGTSVTGSMTVSGTTLTDNNQTLSGFSAGQRLVVGGGVAWGVIASVGTHTITVSSWNGTPQSGMGYAVAGGNSRPHSYFGQFFDMQIRTPQYQQSSSYSLPTGWFGWNTSGGYDCQLGQVGGDNFIWNGYKSGSGFGSIYVASYLGTGTGSPGRFRVWGLYPPTITVGSGSSVYGPVTAATAPSSGSAAVNAYPFPVTVYVLTGTLSAVSINGTSVGTPTEFRIPAGGSVTPTYTGTLTWAWIEE